MKKNSVLKPYKKKFEEAFQTKDLERAIFLITKVLNKRIGGIIQVNRKPLMIKKGSGKYLGYMFAIKNGPDRLRFNWRIGAHSSEITSIDFYDNTEIKPSRTVETKDLNIIQIIDILTSIYRTGTHVNEVLVKDQMKEAFEDFKIDKSKVAKFGHKPSINFWNTKIGSTIPPVPMNDPFFDKLYNEYMEWVEKNKVRKYITTQERFIGFLKQWGATILRKVSIKKAEAEMGMNLPEHDFMVKLFQDLKLDPLNEDEIFVQIEYKINLVLDKRLSGAIIVGTPGVGKSYTVQQMISKRGIGYKEYVLLKGKMSATGLYLNLWEFRDKLIVIDDCDQPLKDDDGINILKSATDTQAKRIVGINNKNYKLNERYLMKAVTDEGYDYDELVQNNEWGLIQGIAFAQDDPIGPPANFVFEGQIIAISNLFEKDIDSALTDRGGFIEVKLTPEQICNRIEKAIPAISEEIGISEVDCKGTLKWVRGIVKVRPDVMLRLSFRKFHTAAGYYASKQNKWQQMALKEIAKSPGLKGR